jgi:beta-xylosidase
MLKSLFGILALNPAKSFVWGIVRLSIVMLVAGSRLNAWSEDTKEIRPGELWLDTAGQPINAHGGGMLFFDGIYYWYGEDKRGDTWLPDCTKRWGGYRVEVSGIHCYSSRDLIKWKDEGLVLKAVPDDPSSDLHPSKVVERPKVVYNEETKKFVMWMHVDDSCYDARRAGVAVADHPTGPFSYLGSTNPEGQHCADQTVFVDDDGKAYHIYASDRNRILNISLLSDDYLKHTGKYIRIFPGKFIEAPVVFKRAGKYWLIGSHCTGWDPNPAQAAVADSIWGPWTYLGNPCSGPGATNTFGAQSTHVFQLPNQPGNFIFMADQWNKTNLPASRYVWLPIHFKEGKLELTWQDSWQLNPSNESSKPARQTAAADTSSSQPSSQQASAAIGSVR